MENSHEWQISVGDDLRINISSSRPLSRLEVLEFLRLGFQNPNTGGNQEGALVYDDDITDIIDGIVRREQEDGGSASGFGAVPASASFLNNLPSTLYSESFESADAEVQNCAICLEKPVTGDRVTKLPCSHLFHTDCIVQWLQNSHLCTLCRHSLPIDE